MSAVSLNTLFFLIWCGHCLISLLGIGLILYWSIMQGQWSGQKRACHLALWAHIESGEGGKSVEEKGGARHVS